MAKKRNETRFWQWAVTIFAVCAWVALPIVNSAKDAVFQDTCASGKSSANLTGWPIDGKYPAGSAEFDRETNRLTVTARSVPLEDGTILRVLIGDDRIGEMQPLKAGETQVVITGSDKVDVDSRVRVFNKDVPLMSGNLVCVEPTPTASPTAVPTSTPLPSPSASPTAIPTASPTPFPPVSPTASPSISPSPTMKP